MPQVCSQLLACPALTHVCCCRVLYQGCSSYADACRFGPNIEWAMTFCPNSTMQLCVGTHAAASTGQAGVAYGGVAWVKSFALAANRLYTFTGFGAAITAYQEGFIGEQAPHGSVA
jgi:hypothetical protein